MSYLHKYVFSFAFMYVICKYLFKKKYFFANIYNVCMFIVNVYKHMYTYECMY